MNLPFQVSVVVKQTYDDKLHDVPRVYVEYIEALKFVQGVSSGEYKFTIFTKNLEVPKDGGVSIIKQLVLKLEKTEISLHWHALRANAIQKWQATIPEPYKTQLMNLLNNGTIEDPKKGSEEEQ